MRAVSAPPLPPGVQRRKQLRQERRADRLRHLWRLLLYCTASAGLAYLLLREGWSLRQPAQVEVIGSSVVKRDQVIQAASLKFPLPLLNLNPKLLGDTLAATLPVEQVQVSRLMLPPRLRVELTDRTAIARAERRTPRGVEKGHVDRLGNWISFPQLVDMTLEDEELNLRVVGWHERHRPTLIELFENIDRIGPSLSEIRFET
jgi:cell division protein FtsQ